MSKVLVTESHLNNIAEAIRAKNGASTTYRPGDMAAAIQAIPTGGITPTGTKNITQNGTHDVTQYASANVNIQPNLQSKTVTQNGTVTPDQGYDGLSSVVVNVSGGGGGATILSGTGAPTAAQGSNGDIYLKYTDHDTSPTGYVFLDYIQFANGTYIDIGLAASDHLIEMKVNDLSYTNDKHWFGNPNSNKYPHFTTYSNRYYWGTGSSEPSGGTWEEGEHILEFNKGSNHAVILDGATIGSGTNISTSYNILIGKRQGTANAANLRVFYFKMYDRTNDGLVRNLIPVKRTSDDVLGMYDLVNNEFYANAGSGTFIAGNVLSGTTIDMAYLKVSGAWQSLIGSSISDVGGI